MAYNIPFSDPTEHPELPNGVRVEDLSLNTTNTSLTFVGKNWPEFSIPIGKNFLHLLENFASKNPPANPVKGQIWYDTDSDSIPARPLLKIYDGTKWIDISGTQKGTSPPAAENSLPGDLWADLSNQQLYLFNGTAWILVGPQYNAGSDSGVRAEQLVDRATDTEKTVLVAYVGGLKVAIISKEEFYPKATIEGFPRIYQGITLSNLDFDSDGLMLNKFWGTSEKADSLVVGNDVVPAANFLRGDVVSTTNYALNIRNSAGLRIGESLETQILTSSVTNTSVLYNKTANSTIYLRPSDNSSLPVDVLTVTGNGQVGINKSPGLLPDGSLAHLDLQGNFKTDGIIKATSTVQSTSYTTGSVQLAGGIGIAKNAYIGGDIDVGGHVTLGTSGGGLVINPRTNEAHDIGADPTVLGTNKRFRAVYAKNFKGDSFTGSFFGNVTGSVTGSAGSLAANTIFKIAGDVSSSIIQFNGAQPVPTRNIIKAQRTGTTARVYTGAVDHQFQVNWFVDINIASLPTLNVVSQPITDIGVDALPNGYWFEYSTSTSGSISLVNAAGTAIPKPGGQFITTLSDNIISDKQSVVDSLDSDFFLLYRASLTPGLRKINKATLFSTAGTVPTGAIFPFAGSTPPPGYLLCDGSEQNTASYPQLFSVIGYTYKPLLDLQGYNTFALPDLRGRFPIGIEGMDNSNTVALKTDATGATRAAITTVGAISTSFTVATVNIVNGPFQVGKVLTDAAGAAPGGLDNTNGPIIITAVQPNVPTSGFTTIVVSMPTQITTFPAASGLTLRSIGTIDGGGGLPTPSRTPLASSLGVVGGKSSQTLTVNQLPQHSHNMKGSAGNQYYAYRYAAGAPSDTGAISSLLHQIGNGAHLLPNSGNINVSGAVGQPIDISNPYQAINYIIFTGKLI